METRKGGNKKENGGSVGEQGQGESRKMHVFIKCHIDALILENWEVNGRRRGKNCKIPAVPLIFSSLPPSLTPSFSLHLRRVTVSDGTGLTGRRRSKKTVAFSSALEMTRDTHTHTHTDMRAHSHIRIPTFGGCQ